MKLSAAKAITLEAPNGLTLLIFVLAIVVSTIVGGVLLTQSLDLSLLTPDGLKTYINQIGYWGPPLYIAIIALSVVVSQVPGAPLAVAAGAIWDPLLAGIYTVAGGFGGALIAYGLGKTMGQSVIKSLTGKTLQFSKERGEAYLGWLIFATRLLPVFSFDLMSYGAGITGLSWPIYASATFFGMIPSTLLLTYLGASFHLSGGNTGIMLMIFAVLFVGLPLLAHRYNWLNLGEIVSWE